MKDFMNFAFDKSARTIDADGRLHIAKSHISKATVNPYYGKEIPGYEELGLEPDKIYQLYRDPVELEKAAPTFQRLPVLSQHVPVTVDSPRPDLVVGAIGSDVSFSAPYLDADLCVWDAKAIAGIDTNSVRELSCAYRYVPIMEPGKTASGQAYDGRMTDIRGNHLALVEVGRAGSDVYAADSNPFEKGRPVKLNKKQASALRSGLMAQDATLSPEQLDSVIDALIGVEDNPEPTEPAPTPVVEDGTPGEKLRALLQGKVDEETLNAACALFPDAPAADELPLKKEEVKAAMDSALATQRAELLAATDAMRDVRPVVGDVMGMDSAEAIYGFALDHLKVDRKDVTGIPALRALFRVAQGAASQAKTTPAITQDAAAKAVQQFPGLARF